MCSSDLSVAEMESHETDSLRRDLLKSHIPLLKDSVKRLDGVISALRSVGSLGVEGGQISASQSEKIMDVVYGAANMLVSWDNFFGTRMQTALQADLSDTLWRKNSLNDAQRQYLLSAGPDIVSKLSGYFTNDPVAERTDLSTAKVAHTTNLKVVEQQFAKVLFNEILDIDCKLEGGFACDARVGWQAYDPAGGFLERSKIRDLNLGLDAYRSGRGLLNGALRWLYPKTEDSKALIQVRAKYCMQALAFESREAFREICKGAELVSDLADRSDAMGLNMSFEKQLENILKTASSTDGERIDKARGAGVCALRSYLRKNHVY